MEHSHTFNILQLSFIIIKFHFWLCMHKHSISCQMTISLIFHIKRPIKPNQDKNFFYISDCIVVSIYKKGKNEGEHYQFETKSEMDIDPFVFNIKTIAALKVFLCWCSFVRFSMCNNEQDACICIYTRRFHDSEYNFIELNVEHSL